MLEVQAKFDLLLSENPSLRLYNQDYCTQQHVILRKQQLEQRDTADFKFITEKVVEFLSLQPDRKAPRATVSVFLQDEGREVFERLELHVQKFKDGAALDACKVLENYFIKNKSKNPIIIFKEKPSPEVALKPAGGAVVGKLAGGGAM
jgi:hypothetical protein